MPKLYLNVNLKAENIIMANNLIHYFSKEIQILEKHKHKILRQFFYFIDE